MIKKRKPEGITDIAKYIPAIVAIINKNLGTSYYININDEGSDSTISVNTQNWMLNWDVLEPLAEFCIKNDVTWEIQATEKQEIIIKLTTKQD